MTAVPPRGPARSSEPRPARSSPAADAAALRDIVERQAGGVLVVDASGVVRFVNPAAERLLGRELVGEDFGFPLVVGEMTDVNVVAAGGAVRTVAMQVSELDWQGQPAHLVALHDVSGRARRYEEEHRSVEILQRSLLPERLPFVPAVTLAARYLPGGPVLEVGGDWYDAIPLEDGAIGLVIGDVAGHGLESAALMGQLRNALRAYALEGHTPGAALERLDRLVERLEPDRTATLLYLVLEPGDERLRLANAGHLPPLVVGPDGDVRLIAGGRSLPLGTGTGLPRGELTMPLEPGSSLVLYTDGLVERRSSSLDAGLEQLLRAASAAPTAPEELCDHVLDDLLQGDAPGDDVAIMVVRTLPLSDERLTLTLGTRPDSLRAMRRLIDGWLRRMGASDDERRDVKLACHEACANAVEHGLRFAETTFELDARREGRKVEIVVRDRGRWREPPPTPALERGRGLVLIRALMTSVDVTSGPAGTEVEMRRELA